MKVVSLSGSLREGVGKKDAKKCRKEGLVPCVLYGGEKQIHFAVKANEFEKFIFTPHVQLIDLTIEGETYRTMIQDVQYHPVSDKTLHADFLQVIEGKPVKISVPITITGTSPGVLKGGKLTMKMRRLHIMALENNLPDTLEVDISNLEIAQSIRVENLVREDIIFLDAPRAVVVTVKAGRGAVVAAEEETEGEHTEAAPQE